MKQATLASLELFRAIPELGSASKPVDTLAKGFFITDSAWKHNPIINDILEDIEDMYGYDEAYLNNAFKTFKQASTDSIEKMFADQIMHYFTTYGFEALNIKSDYVYVPNKIINLPEDADPVKVLVIKSITKEEILERINLLLSSGAALSEKTQDNIFTLIRFFKFTPEIDKVKNKEFKIRLYDYYKTVPKNELEWLRYVVYKMTGSSLLIKNEAVFNAIASTELPELDGYFKKITLEQLATIFYRFKPIFLAMRKSNPSVKKHVNRIRRLANTYHEPMKEKVLDIVTKKAVSLDELEKELKKISIFKQISLANAIIYRRSNPSDIAYFIRNGKAFVTKYDNTYVIRDEVLNLVMNSIVNKLRRNVEGKTVYIPSNMTYAMPTSEKMFWNNIPFNSSIQLKENAVIGVHWVDTNSRTDLDLSLQSDAYHISWCDQFRHENNKLREDAELIFSGDMTSAPAPKGATECFYISDNVSADELCMIDLRNYTDNGTVDFSFIIDSPDKDLVTEDYLINSHTMNFCLKNTLKNTSMFLGFLDISKPTKTFYFTSSTMSNSIMARYDEKTSMMTSAMRTRFESCLKLNDLLKIAGAKFEKDNDSDWDINLDANQATKDTFLSLLG